MHLTNSSTSILNIIWFKELYELKIILRAFEKVANENIYSKVCVILMTQMSIFENLTSFFCLLNVSGSSGFKSVLWLRCWTSWILRKCRGFQSKLDHHFYINFEKQSFIFTFQVLFPMFINCFLILRKFFKIYTPEQGLEPWTLRLKVWCSTDWAIRAHQTPPYTPHFYYIYE